MSRAMPRSFHIPALDRMAVGLSGLCVVHCVLSVIFVAVLSGAGTLLTNPLIHRVGLFGAVVLATFALGQGYMAHRATRPALIGLAGIALMTLGLFAPHGWGEVAATVAGVSILAAAHLMNASARTSRADLSK
jgi:hypothetical protein